MKTAARVLVAVLLVAILLPALASACPLCKEAASTTEKPGQSGMWRGMYWSILLMVAMPFMMVGGMILAVRRAKRRHDAALPRPPAPLPFPETGARL
jgi:hypothetical protein